jgi:hypothetical protein
VNLQSQKDLVDGNRDNPQMGYPEGLVILPIFFYFIEGRSTRMIRKGLFANDWLFYMAVFCRFIVRRSKKYKNDPKRVVQK